MDIKLTEHVQCEAILKQKKWPHVQSGKFKICTTLTDPPDADWKKQFNDLSVEGIAPEIFKFKDNQVCFEWENDGWSKIISELNLRIFRTNDQYNRVRNPIIQSEESLRRSIETYIKDRLKD